MIEAPNSFNRKYLEEARDSYTEAHNINRYDLYSGLNVARLSLLLSKWDKALFEQAQEQFKKQILLCRFAVQESPNDFWRMFDLADALLFSGDAEEAYQFYNRAVDLIPKDERKDKLDSVINPFKDFIAANILDENQMAKVQKVVDILARE